MYTFNPGDLEDIQAEQVERGIQYPSIQVISEKPIVATSRKVPESYKNQTDIKKSLMNDLDVLFTDHTGGSYYILEYLYRENNWTNLACNTIAAACVGSKPMFRFESEKADKKYLDDLQDFFDYPNLIESGYQMQFKLILSLAIFGTTFVQIIRKKNGQLHSMYHIPTPSMRVKPFINSETGLLENFYLQLDELGQTPQRVYFQDEIIQISLPNPFSGVYGLPPSVPLFKDLTFDLEAKKWINSWFQKTFNAGMIFKMPNSNRDVVNRNRQELKEKYEGASNAGRTMVLEGDMEIVHDGNKARDLNLDVLKQISRDDIMSSYGVPLSVAGIRSDKGQANVEVINSEEQAFLRNTVTKYQSLIVGAFNQKLFRYILKRHDIKMYAGTNTMFNMKRAIDIASTAMKLGGLSINEFRELFGMLPLENSKFGDTPIVATNNTIVPLEDLFTKFKESNMSGVGIDPAPEPTVAVNPEKGTLESK